MTRPRRRPRRAWLPRWCCRCISSRDCHVSATLSATSLIRERCVVAALQVPKLAVQTQTEPWGDELVSTNLDLDLDPIEEAPAAVGDAAADAETAKDLVKHKRQIEAQRRMIEKSEAALKAAQLEGQQMAQAAADGVRAAAQAHLEKQIAQVQSELQAQMQKMLAEQQAR